MNAVIYARYSSDSQREESIEGQIRECTAFAEKNGITVLRHYIDRAFSAKTDNRPEFQNMIKDSNKKLFDTVIVWKLDRFARNRYDSARHKATLKKNGVKVVSATEAIADGSVGIMMETILEGMAEYYSVDLSEKVVRGMTDNALKCMFNGGTLPIGYIIDKEQHFQIDPVTSPFVLAAFEKYADGATMTEVRDYLNENGVTNTRGKPMTYNSIQHLLNNRRYIGEYVYREIVVPDGIPAIVPIDLFERVQEKMAKNKKAPARHKAEDDYLLTTKLFCGHCGAYMCGESGTSRTGVVHHYYKCVSVKKKRAECHKKPVKKRWIEDLVVAEAMKMVMDDDVVDAIVSMLMDLQGRENTNLPLYQQQLKETETKIENLLKAITEGVFTKSTKTLLEELEAAKEELENRIALEKLEKPQISEEFMRFWLHRFRKLDMAKKEHRQMLIDVLINAIFLYDDKMLITFNYKEGTQTITFDDVKNEVSDETSGSDLDCSSAPESTLYSLFCYFVLKSERDMKNTYKKLIERGIDLSPLGVEMRGEKVRYFCTPKYADIIGYEGADGVHCCFIRGFKDAVFTVSPMNEPGKHVAKAAECFEDFLSLLLSCRHLAAIEQVNMFTKDEFQEFISCSEVTAEMQKAFDDLKNFGVKPMENPYDYLKAMRDGFDGSKIKYEDEYYDWVPKEPKMPKWKVTFDGDFTNRSRARRGREIPVNFDFEWDGKEGVIPAVYLFGKGVVIDCCVSVKREETDNFAQKAKLSEETGRADELEEENPLDIDIAPTLFIDGKEIKEYSGCGTVFCHLNDEGINDGKYVAEHYGLNMERDWMINRFAFPVKIKKDEDHHIELRLSQRPKAVKGPRFKGQKGEKVEFISPINGIKHTLTVTDIETEKLPDWTFNEPNMEFPLNYAVMSYTVEPPIPDGELMISDNSGGDRPIVKVQDPMSPEASCCVGIIGGADGPTAIYLGQSTVHSACSSLYFEEPLSIMWKMKFYKKDSEDIVLNIL